MATDKALNTILKLFRLGAEGSGATEAEMLAAVTTAKSMMMKHKISAQDVQAAINQAMIDGRPAHLNIKVDSYSAYTRKMRKLARYDEIIAMAVGELTATEPILRSISSYDGQYISMNFVGDERDIKLAAELFMIWLPEVRRATRQTYGSHKWNIDHTSYAVGYATRILDRAKAAAPATAQEANAMALVLVSTKDAIARYKEEQGIAKVGKVRRTAINSAYHEGYRDGGSFNMNTKVVR